MVFAEPDGNNLAVKVVIFQPLDRLVEHNPTVVDHHSPSADLLDIAGVMAGQKNGRPLFLIQLTDQLTDGLLDNHIQTYGRFVKKENFWFVQQRSRNFTANSLAERHFANRHIQ